MTDKPKNVSLYQFFQRFPMRKRRGSTLRTTAGLAECPAPIASQAILNALKQGEFTFGNNRTQVTSQGSWKKADSFEHKLLSFISIVIIVLGKKVNAFLSLLGIKFPKKLTRLIRSRI